MNEKQFNNFRVRPAARAVRVWDWQGHQMHKFLGHSKPIMALVAHPQSDALVLTAGQDLTLRMWSLHTFTLIYKVFDATAARVALQTVNDFGGAFR